VKLANAVSTGDSNYNGKFGTQLDVQNLDDDQVGFTVDAAAMLQTTEKVGPPATFTVALQSKPQGTTTVTLALKSSNAKEGTVSPSQLVFTGIDWDQPHTVTVTGVDDKKADGDVGYQIVFSPAVSDDTGYSGKFPPAVALTNVDDDTLGVLVATTTCSTTPGTSATFTIQLSSQPTAGVSISLTSSLPTEGTVDPVSVSFTTANWDTPQTVTVTGVDDASMGMMTPYKIITGDASAPGEATGYDGFHVADVSCTNTTPPAATP